MLRAPSLGVLCYMYNALGAPPTNCIFRTSRFQRSRYLQRIQRFCVSRSTASDKPFYITTPIFYVNAAPHIGHLYSLVLTDIVKRWQTLSGRQALLCTGTDEHGMKIQRAASKAASEPQVFCDRSSNVFKELVNKANISNDTFIRTTDLAHRDAVQFAWTKLVQNDYIYLSKHEGWYSVSDETFFPQSGVHLVVDPPTGRKIMVSIETGKEVEWTSETNYRFRLSVFREKLLEFYQSNPNFIVPEPRMKEVVKSVTLGLDDLSVSRPAERLRWGIPVPTDNTQTIYVWLDALINYITAAGYPFSPGHESAGGWPADLHVIGKEIVRFHCIYWPAFLIALNLPLPKQILTHAFWTLGREKMAKSTGNVVNPFFAIDRFGLDSIRYYLAHDGGILHDSDYGNEYIIERYKHDLQGGLGNLASRIVRGKGWNVRRAVKKGTAGTLDNFLDGSEVLRAQRDILRGVASKAEIDMAKLNIGVALRAIMEVIFRTNSFLSVTQPWKFAQAEAQANLDQLDAIIFLSAEALRIVGILLQPFMPQKASSLLDMLGVLESSRSLAFAKPFVDQEYGNSRVDIGRGHVGVLFPPLSSES